RGFVNPTPIATGLTPASAVAGAPGTTVTVRGDGDGFKQFGFPNNPGAVVRWDGSDRPTTANFEHTALRATLPSADRAVAGPVAGGPAGCACLPGAGRPQPAASEQPRTLGDHRLLAGGEAPSPARGVTARQAPAPGQYQCYMLGIRFPSPLEPRDRYRLRLRV